MTWRSIASRAKQAAARDDGQDLTEYGLLAALIAIAVMTGVSALGAVIKTRFWDVVADLL
jgi:Flp pilus assembly pilin Flp